VNNKPRPGRPAHVGTESCREIGVRGVRKVDLNPQASSEWLCPLMMVVGNDVVEVTVPQRRPHYPESEPDGALGRSAAM
jgi:hypothetical protein